MVTTSATAVAVVPAFTVGALLRSAFSGTVFSATVFSATDLSDPLSGALLAPVARAPERAGVLVVFAAVRALAGAACPVVALLAGDVAVGSGARLAALAALIGVAAATGAAPLARVPDPLAGVFAKGAFLPGVMWSSSSMTPQP